MINALSPIVAFLASTVNKALILANAPSAITELSAKTILVKAVLLNAYAA